LEKIASLNVPKEPGLLIIDVNTATGDAKLALMKPTVLHVYMDSFLPKQADVSMNAPEKIITKIQKQTLANSARKVVEDANLTHQQTL